MIFPRRGKRNADRSSIMSRFAPMGEPPGRAPSKRSPGGEGRGPVPERVLKPLIHQRGERNRSAGRRLPLTCVADELARSGSPSRGSAEAGRGRSSMPVSAVNRRERRPGSPLGAQPALAASFIAMVTAFHSAFLAQLGNISLITAVPSFDLLRPWIVRLDLHVRSGDKFASERSRNPKCRIPALPTFSGSLRVFLTVVEDEAASPPAAGRKLNQADRQ